MQLFYYYNLMTTELWIFSGLISLAIILYLVGLFKNIVVMEKISRALILPFVTYVILTLLKRYLPDSHHIIMISGISLLIFSFTMIFSVFTESKILNALMVFLFEAGILSWESLCLPIFRIARISDFTIILSSAIFLIAFILICILLGKQKFSTGCSVLILISPTVFFLFTATISLIYEKRIFNILLVSGAVISLAEALFFIFQKLKPFNINRRTENLINSIFVISSQALIGSSAIMMFVK